MVALVPHRVCHIVTTLELGGAQQNTLYTVQHLDRGRFTPSLVCGPEGLLHDEARGSGVDLTVVKSLCRAISPGRDARAFVTLVRHLRALQPTIVHTHSSKAGVVGRWAARAARVPITVHSIHGFAHPRAASTRAQQAMIAAERATARVATSAFIAVSRANLAEGRALGIIGEHPARVIRSGIELERFRNVAKGRRAGGALRVGMVACLKPQKAPLDFVRVAARVRKARRAGQSPVRFILVGDGPLRRAVDSEIAREHLEDHVELLGWRRDIPELLASFDVLLHTSHWEGLPRVFPEAMATGLPIVATAVDGAPEAIEDGVTGYLCAAGDVDALADRLTELLDDEGLRARFGRAAEQRVEPWDIDAMVRDQQAFYEELWAAHAADSPRQPPHEHTERARR